MKKQRSANNKISVSVHFVRAVLAHTLKRGVDAQALLRRHRIPPRLLQEPQARISAQQFADLQTHTMQAMGDETLGYGLTPMQLGTWEMMCYAVINSHTLGQALHRYCRFFQLIEGSVSLHMHTDHDSSSIVMHPSAKQLGPYLSELCMFNTHRFACWLVQEELPLREVCFSNSSGARALDYRLMFLGYPVRFDESDTHLTLARSLLEKPITQTADSLRRFLRHPTLLMLTANYAFSWTSQVRERLREDLLHMPELTQVATALELHPQTLRRRLSGEGSSFKQIKSDVRRDTALHFLSKRSLSVEEVAYRSGFSEASAFIRAFKAWTGLTPYAYRKGL